MWTYSGSSSGVENVPDGLILSSLEKELKRVVESSEAKHSESCPLARAQLEHGIRLCRISVGLYVVVRPVPISRKEFEMLCEVFLTKRPPWPTVAHVTTWKKRSSRCGMGTDAEMLRNHFGSRGFSC